jgi:tRNA nucleotidyltransferase (CCA-adding enzyme)
MSNQPISIGELPKALEGAYPELEQFGSVGARVYLVGGAVRDLLIGRERGDLDVVVVGNPVALAERLGAAEVVEHERFATAKLVLSGHEIDVAAARTEAYPQPGALPEVTPAMSIETDLARRDFTLNAMAIPLGGEPTLIDPHGGWEDLDAGLLRILHPRSFEDDPTRALRAARYAARFGLELEPETAARLRETDLSTVSGDRRRAELVRLAAEPTAIEGLRLLSEWGLLELREGGIELTQAVEELLEQEPWRSEVYRPEAILSAALGPPGAEGELAAARPRQPSEAVALARGRGGVELVLARALGAEWIDGYLGNWRWVRLEIDGKDLIAEGIPEGPALGRGLDAALRKRLDGEVSGRDEELAAALAAAREG